MLGVDAARRERGALREGRGAHLRFATRRQMPIARNDWLRNVGRMLDVILLIYVHGYL